MDKEIVETKEDESEIISDNPNYSYPEEHEDESGFLESSREFGLFWRSIGGSSIG